MHWMDVVVVVIWGFLVWYSWGRGLFESIAEMVVWVIVASVLAVFLTPLEHYLIRSFGLTQDWAPFVAILFITSLVGLGVYIVIQAVANKVPRQHYSVFWHVAIGLVPSVVTGGIVVMFLMIMLVSLSVGDIEGVRAGGSWFYSKAIEVLKYLHGIKG